MVRSSKVSFIHKFLAKWQIVILQGGDKVPAILSGSVSILCKIGEIQAPN